MCPLLSAPKSPRPSTEPKTLSGPVLRDTARLSQRYPPISGTKKEHKPKLLSPDMMWWGRGLPREGVGAKKFGMSLETREIKLFGQDIPGFPGVSRPCPKSLRKKC